MKDDTVKLRVEVDDSSVKAAIQRLKELQELSDNYVPPKFSEPPVSARHARAQEDGVHAAQHDDAAQSVEVWRHVKTGGEYGGRTLAPLQCSGARHLEAVRWCVYYSRDTGDAYVRPLDEFMDGRFEPVNEGARAAQLAWRAELDNAVETEAKRIHESWRSDLDWKPWISGGAALKQELARTSARIRRANQFAFSLRG